MRRMSKEVKNRILIWNIVLQRAYEAMVADDRIWEMIVANPLADEYNCEYKVGNLRGNVNVLLSAHRALQTEAVILFCQIFTSGNAGPGIAANRHDADVASFRDDMESHVKTALGWGTAKYHSVFQSITTIRHKLTAHYDGKAAEYDEPMPGIVHRMKSPGVNFPQGQDRTDFISLIGASFEFVRDELIKSGS